MDGLIEPYLIKAISLLHSSAKDSGDQLKSMLDEAIRLKNETNSSVSKLPPPLTMIKRKKSDFFIDEDVPLSKRRKESPRSSQPSSPSSSVLEKNKESKRKHDNMFNDDEVVPKKFKDSPRSSQPGSPAGSSPRNSRSPSVARKSDDLDSLNDADDLAQEIMDLHCVICTGLDVTSGNQLVECQECHGLYHQECHQPNISDAEVNDPRSVFFCSDCSKSMKKTASRPKSSSSRESPITFYKSRSDSPSSVSGKSSAGLVVNFSKQQTLPQKPNGGSGASSKSTSSSSSSSNSSSGNTIGNTSLINADKRLQNIKKRAATKLQEKRKPGK
ncbi:integrator complex subunit 12-like isoform X2 [Daphnia pulex]|uniref:integrator complex subunit 12-like isoform X2 n=1 Tax=Daphnia pulex TaxID=6669 RepID=UPI001EDDC4FD|nr:integrator complex subunit 12-like isoform X2 [Daphnia pulex]XP_046646047.1 integrator complex subunit 12-like isoform X2 [Daphnia pulicaria]